MSGETEEFERLIGDQLVTIGRSLDELHGKGTIKITIDGQPLEMNRVTLAYDAMDRRMPPRRTTIYDAVTELYLKELHSQRGELDPTADPVARARHPIPVLCHREHMRPAAVCRVCMVELKGFPRLVPACHQPIEPDMVISTIRTSPRVQQSVKILTELLMTDHRGRHDDWRQSEDNELKALAGRLELPPSRFAPDGIDRGQDESSPVIAVDHNACIMCDRCVRACDEVKENGVIGRMNKGYGARIAFDLNDPMGESSCVACGECMISCPTGALSNRLVLDIRPEPKPGEKNVLLEGEPVGVDELVDIPLFTGISRRFLEWNHNAIVRRRYKKRDPVCREGDFGATAFIIEKGEFDVRINTLANQAAKKSGGILSWLGRRAAAPADRPSPPKEGISIDAPGALAPNEQGVPVATLTPRDVIFGEMTCMNHYPRSATVTAASDDCQVLEVLRNVLYMLRRSDSSKKILDRLYRERSLDNLLRRVKLFADLPPDVFAKVLEYLKQPEQDPEKERVKLVRVHPGQVIFREGDKADHFYMVRIGFVKVSQRWPGGERVLSYLKPGEFFGEIGLLARIPGIQQRLGISETRTATCTAMDHVDLMRIDGNVFTDVLGLIEQSGQRLSDSLQNPVSDRLEETARKSLEQNRDSQTRLEHVPLEEFLRQGLMEAQSVLVLDLEKCTRCDECSKACVDAHPANPDGDASMVTRLIRDGLRFDKFLVASSCRSCLDPYCVVGCPVGSIHRNTDGTILITDWCVGCGLCERNCPYGNIKMHETQGKAKATAKQRATTCDLCVGLDGQPSCVYACPHDAAHRMTGQELIDLIQPQTFVGK